MPQEGTLTDSERAVVQALPEKVSAWDAGALDAWKRNVTDVADLRLIDDALAREERPGDTKPDKKKSKKAGTHPVTQQVIDDMTASGARRGW